MAMNFKYPRVVVTDYQKWGALVKKWVRDPNARPKDLADLRLQCSDAQIGITIPSYLEDLKFEQPPLNLLLIKLPPAELIEDSENVLKSGSSYDLPLFYEKRFGNPPDLPTIKDKLDFHDERVGDYTISLCV